MSEDNNNMYQSSRLHVVKQSAEGIGNRDEIINVIL